MKHLKRLSHRYLKYEFIKRAAIIAVLMCAFLGFNEQITNFISKWIVPILSFKPNVWTDILVVLCSGLACTWTIIKGPYKYSFFHISIIIFLWLFYIFYAFSSDFTYTKIWIIPYFFILLFVPTSGIIIKCCIVHFKNKQIEAFNAIDNLWALDESLTDYTQDRMGFMADVRNLLWHIQLTSSRQSVIGITAPWGAGKTSFLNLVKLELKKDPRYILIEFNPRGSAGIETIQRDFMDLLGEAMKCYHSSFSSYLKDYIETLRLIDDNNPIINWISHLGLAGIERTKNRIQNILISTKKKLVVLIDDLDRLTADEIIEVLKLIDINSSFPNTYFISAYDKTYVNGVLESKFHYKSDSSYIDKYFSIEYSLPNPKYRRIYAVLDAYLHFGISHLDTEDSNELSSVLSKMEPICKKILPTIRDMKRFYNLFMSTYQNVKDDVHLKDYFVLTLIRYSYPAEYRRLALKEFITTDFSSFSNIYYLNEKAEQQSSIELLRLLFPYQKGTSIYNPADKTRHIFYTRSFDTYFSGYDMGNLNINDLSILMDDDIPLMDIYNRFKSWNTVGQQNDIVDYLLSIDIQQCGQNKLLRYIRILFIFTYVYGCDLNVYNQLHCFFSKESSKDLRKQFDTVMDGNYKAFLSLSAADIEHPEYPTVFLNKHANLITQDTDYASDSIFSIGELHRINISRLEKYISQSNPDKQRFASDVFFMMEGCIEQKEGMIDISPLALNMVQNSMITNPDLFANFLLCHTPIPQDTKHIYLSFKILCHIDKLFASPVEFENSYLYALQKVAGDSLQYKTLTLYMNRFKDNALGLNMVKQDSSVGIIKSGDYKEYYRLLRNQ